MDEKKEILVNETGSFDDQAQVTTSLGEAEGGKYYNKKNYIAEKDSPTKLEGSISTHEVAVLANSINPQSTTSLPYLTTPPLTPPRDRPVNDLPTNGNRNNVADCVHPKTDNFTTTSRACDSKTVLLSNHVVRFSDSPRQNGGLTYVSSSRMDTEPPALVIMMDDGTPAMQKNKEDENREKREYAEAEKDHFQEIAWKNPRKVSEMTPGKVRSGIAISHNVAASSTFRDDDHTSSEEEEVEEMDLLLVEEEEEEKEASEILNTVVRSVEAESSTSSFPQSTSITSESVGDMANISSPASCTTNRETDSLKTERIHASSRSPQIAHTTSNHVNISSSSGGSNDHLMRANHATLPVVSAVAGGGVGETASKETSQNGGDRFSGDLRDEKNKVYAHQAAKVKQVFTTIQDYANRMGRDVAEQVQELIHAVMNKTASVEEFRHEIQTITNYPMKEFIIPFLRENIKYLQAELKESTHVLSDILGNVATFPTVVLTPQPYEDDELPVLPSSSKSIATMPTVRTVSSSLLHNSIKTPTPTSSTSFLTLSPSTASRTAHPHSVSNNTIPNHSHGIAMVVQVQSHSTTSSVATAGTDDGFDSGFKHHGNGVNSSYSGQKRRRLSTERGTTIIADNPPAIPDKSHTSTQTWPKRARTDVNDNMVVVPNPRTPLSFPHPPPTTHIVNVPSTRPSSTDKQPVYPTFSQEHHFRRRGTMLSEDWGHVDMMLNSVQGMVERTRQSMASLKERVHTTHAEMERKEVDQDLIIQQRVLEAVEKAKRQAKEERQRLLMDANKQMRDAVASMRAEVEQKMQQSQNLAIQEALKEANAQTSSKESCWNCGRRATETCSGCNKARYCGAFCQHKDWANHMHHCASGLQGEQSVYSGGSHDSSHPQHHQQVSVTLPTGDVSMATNKRAIPVVAQQHQRTVAIPVGLIGRPQEMNLRLAPGQHLPQGHREIIIKSEKT